MSEIIDHERRRFLQFMGRTTFGGWALGTVGTGLLTSCASGSGRLGKRPVGLGFSPLLPLRTDQLELASGFSAKVLIKWDDPINAKEHFGFNCDYIGMIPFSKDEPDQAYLWVNHEAADPQFVSGHLSFQALPAKTRAQAEKEMRAVGGSLLHVRRDSSGEWNVLRNSGINRRWDATTEIAFSGGQKVLGAKHAAGTLANCSGGITPWQSFLTCEENYHHYFGEVSFDARGQRKLTPARISTGWDSHFPRPPEHYGWVVEIDPRNGKTQKLLSMGRFAHEGSTCVLARDGRCVVYMGDDQENQFFYKFVSAKPGRLDMGTLYVANLEKGQWLPLDIQQNPILKKTFPNQLQVMIRTREAARLLGATPLDRPEDCDVDPVTGAVILACSNNRPAGRPYGSLLKLEEQGRDFTALKFTTSQWMMGGRESGFACPDNLCFDPAGNLWMTTDIADEDLNTPNYAFHGNNCLFVIPMKGALAGIAFRVATAPMDAELTGPCFSADGKTLFLSVQHPGYNSKGPKALTSHWPEGADHLPKPSVVTIQGPSLEALTSV